MFSFAVVTLAQVGTMDGAPAAAWGEALAKNGRWAQLSGFLHALAGLSLASFAWSLHQVASRGPERGIAPWGLFAGLAWAMSLVLGGALIFSSVETAGYQQHPDGAKTSLILGHLLYANPIAALLGGAFASACGVATFPAWPGWFRPFSKAVGGLTLGVTVLGSVGGIGLLAMGPLALWLLVTSAVAAWRSFDPGPGASTVATPPA